MRTLVKGGIKYRVPFPITERKASSIAMKWLVDVGRTRVRLSNEPFPSRMAKQLINAYNNEGAVVAKKIEVSRHAESNRAYAHYRF